MEKIKVIVLGGTGYIGSHTVLELINSKYEVIIADNLSNSSESIVDQVHKISGIRPIFEKVNLDCEIESKDFYSKYKDAEAIINFASLKAVGESVQIPIKYYKNNLNILLNTLEGMLENGINNLIFSSSATVYGLPNTLPITEDEPTKRPTSPYGNTKRISEEVIEDVISVNPSINAISLRYFNPIGAHESGYIGENPQGVPNNLLPFITQTAIGIRKKLMIFGNDYPTKDGTPLRDYIHVMDLAEAHIKSIERLIKKENTSGFEIFNLGSGEGYSVMDIVNTFENVTSVPVNHEITERRSGDVPALYASSIKANEELKWKVTRDLKTMISSSWKWEQYLRNN